MQSVCRSIGPFLKLKESTISKPNLRFTAQGNARHGCNLPVRALSEPPLGFPEDAGDQKHSWSLLRSLQQEAGKILWLLDQSFGVVLSLKMP